MVLKRKWVFHMQRKICVDAFLAIFLICCSSTPSGPFQALFSSAASVPFLGDSLWGCIVWVSKTQILPNLQGFYRLVRWSLSVILVSLGSWRPFYGVFLRQERLTNWFLSLSKKCWFVIHQRWWIMNCNESPFFQFVPISSLPHSQKWWGCEDLPVSPAVAIFFPFTGILLLFNRYPELGKGSQELWQGTSQNISLKIKGRFIIIIWEADCIAINFVSFNWVPIWLGNARYDRFQASLAALGSHLFAIGILWLKCCHWTSSIIFCLHQPSLMVMGQTTEPLLMISNYEQWSAGGCTILNILAWIHLGLYGSKPASWIESGNKLETRTVSFILLMQDFYTRCWMTMWSPYVLLAIVF